MLSLLIATNNPNKLSEFQTLLSQINFEVKSPDVDLDPEETGSTFQENALIKAKAFALAYPDNWIVAEDSGLIVDALNGRPGVYSKRYGDDDLHRNQKLLEELKNTKGADRSARFQTTICLIQNDQIKYFTGIVEGKIADSIRGTEGFGYDPIFIPEGHDQTFAELGQSVKNQLSHRARAIRQLVKYLKDSSFLA